jgi:osmotically-inducible protein OsmY
MKHLNYLWCVAVLGGAAALAQQSGTSGTAADNTRTNQHESSNSTGNADDQKQNASDVKLTAEIRKSVVGDKSLSTYAHNVKIVAVNGSVTLNGVVRSEEEKRTIEMKAAQVAGKDHVVNDLKVQPAQ